MELHALLAVVFGGIVLLTAWVPMLIREMPLSLPIFCIAAGVLLGSLPPLAEQPNPLENRYLAERLTEAAVVISLMGAGLKLDRPFSLRRWSAAWRMLGVAMPLTIAAIAVAGWGLLGLAWPAAVLLGAVLAPTDPVLASDVQTGPPGSGDEDETRFALTSEAGLNDGLAFPFVFLAIALAGYYADGRPFLGDWLLVDVVWKIAAGVGVGWLLGRAVGFLAFRLPDRARLSRTGDGFVALGVASAAYGLAELAHGYGFLAVFVAAVAMRRVEGEHSYHAQLHAFAEQIERLFMMVVLVCFGAVLAEGSLIAAVSWQSAAVAVLVIFLVRPLAGWVALAGAPLLSWQKAVVACYGIRGIGSFYYLAFAFGEARFGGGPTLWITVSLVVLLSILLHGTTVTPVMRRFERGS